MGDCNHPLVNDYWRSRGHVDRSLFAIFAQPAARLDSEWIPNWMKQERSRLGKKLKQIDSPLDQLAYLSPYGREGVACE